MVSDRKSCEKLPLDHGIIVVQPCPEILILAVGFMMMCSSECHENDRRIASRPSGKDTKDGLQNAVCGTSTIAIHLYIPVSFSSPESLNWMVLTYC